MAAADYRMMTDATGQDLVAALQNLAPLQVAPLVVSITTGQWSGSGNDYYITVNASNVTANSIVVPIYDADSRSRLKGPVWCVPAAGSFTIHTSAIPTNTVTILVQIPGTMGEAQYQVLADVYSKSQAVAKADIVDNLTSTNTDKPLSANMGKTLNEAIAQSTANLQVPTTTAADLNDCIAPGFYKATTATLNRPESGSRYYAVFVMPFSSTDRAQIAIEVNLTRMHIRSMESGTWHAWKTVTLT